MEVGGIYDPGWVHPGVSCFGLQRNGKLPLMDHIVHARRYIDCCRYTMMSMLLGPMSLSPFYRC